MNPPILGMAAVALTVMILTTVCLGPGVGVEANCVLLQTCGKTLVPAAADMLRAAGLGLTRKGARVGFESS